MSFKSFFFGNKTQQQSNTSETMTTSDGDKKMDSPHTLITMQSTFNYIKYANEYTISFRSGIYRTPLAYEDGGMTCGDQKQVDKLRSVGKEVLKMIGRKILSGSFNLTKISFPIRACVPKTALYNSVVSCSTFPYFMKRACLEESSIERFKLTIAAIISAPYYVNMFLKPLNPILGQTLQASLQDGTKIYAEQISHHPPISYFLIVGPQESYQFSGYYNFQISPSFNSLKLQNLGKRKFRFKDGSEIISSFPMSEFSGTFFGTSRCEQLGQCVITDSKNSLQSKIEFGLLKKKPTDHFQSFITHKGKPVCKIDGTYCGYIDYNGQRYWDGRDIQPFPIKMEESIKLPSDWSYRPDLIELQKGNIDEGQMIKQHLEQLQRKDAKLRNKNHKKQ